jgi:hypothetical protein
VEELKTMNVHEDEFKHLQAAHCEWVTTNLLRGVGADS